MATSNILVCRAIPPEAHTTLEAAGIPVWTWPEPRPIDREVLLRQARDAVAVLAALTDRIDEDVMAAAPGLRVIANWAVGVDNIDVAAATRRGIPVGHTPDVLTETSADLAFGLLMAVARRIAEGDRLVRSGGWGTWDPDLLLGVDVWGATLGIVGMGRIGRAMARRGRGFGMRVVYWSRSRLAEDEEEELEARWCESLAELLGRADFVTLHASLNEASRHLIDAERIRQMKPGAIVVNTGRGGLLDQAALTAALASGHLGGAGLDVTDPEPIPMDDPLLTMPNVVITPHIGSASRRTRTAMAIVAARNILAGLHGEPLPHCVNPEVYRTGGTP